MLATKTTVHPQDDGSPIGISMDEPIQQFKSLADEAADIVERTKINGNPTLPLGLVIAALTENAKPKSDMGLAGVASAMLHSKKVIVPLGGTLFTVLVIPDGVEKAYNRKHRPQTQYAAAYFPGSPRDRQDTDLRDRYANG